MKVIINISQELFEDIQAGYYTENVRKMAIAIGNGTPIPEGHGRIADMDEVIKCLEEVEGEDAIWAISLIEWACSKRTIIEADKAESEE